MLTVEGKVQIGRYVWWIPIREIGRPRTLIRTRGKAAYCVNV